MGAILSMLGGPNNPNAVQTLPLQRTGVQDGTSGLHYSGRLYSNQFQQLSSDVCNGASASVAQIAEVMPNSISTESLSVDPSTKRISTSSLQGYVQGLISSGKIPGKLGSFEQPFAKLRRASSKPMQLSRILASRSAL